MLKLALTLKQPNVTDTREKIINNQGYFCFPNRGGIAHKGWYNILVLWWRDRMSASQVKRDQEQAPDVAAGACNEKEMGGHLVSRTAQGILKRPCGCAMRGSMF